MKIFKLPIIISLLIHSMVFLSLAWIKLGAEYKDTKMIAIEFFKQKQERLVRRPMPVYSKYIIYNFTDQHIPVKNIQRRQIDTLPALTHINIQPSLYFENINYSNNRLGSFNNIPTKSMLHAKYIPLQRISTRPYLRSISNINGNKFIIDKLPGLAKPDMKVSFIKKDDNLLRKYLETVRKKIEKNKKYPLSAMNYNIEGRSGVKFNILIDGKLEDVKIIDSSGSEILDQAALDSVYSSAPFPSIPPDIDMERIEVVVYIVFKISQFGRF